MTITPLFLKLLHALNTRSFFSMNALAERFGCRRAVISSALHQAAALGIPVQRAPRLGYRLATPLDWLCPTAIQSGLSGAAADWTIEVLPTIDSTNSHLLHQAVHTQHGHCLATEYQTDGKGRRGRQWQAGFAGSLLFSCLLRWPFGVAQISGLSLVVGMAIARTLGQIGVQHVQLKWPNDVLIDGEKVAGVLIETQGDALGPLCVVIGIGLNLRLPLASRRQIQQPVTDLAVHLSALPTRNTLLTQLLNTLAGIIQQFEPQGFSPFAEEWQRYHAWEGKVVLFKQSSGAYASARLCGIAPDGALLMDRQGELERWVSGELLLAPLKPQENKP